MHQYPNVFKHAKFDTFVLCCLASKLRQGSRCKCDPSQTPAYGSFNWAILLTFEDGVRWILRSLREDNPIKSSKMNLLLLASEAATLKYLRITNTLPVPEVFAYREVNL